MTENECIAYNESLKHYRDIINVVDTARVEGIEEGVRRTAIEMKIDGVPFRKISQYTGLSEAQIQQL